MGKILTIGEIMLRLSTETGVRLSQASSFGVHYGGGEANVAVSLANYQHQVTFASKVPDNSLGEAVEKHLNAYGVNTDFLLKGGPRLGTYYLESGVSVRAANVIYDRALSSFSLMKKSEWDLEDLFAGAELFHISGITAALSDDWAALTLRLVQYAKDHKILVSFDINYRGKLWSQKRAGEVIQTILPYVDYCSAGEKDAIYLLGIAQKEAAGVDHYYQEMSKLFPAIQVFYSTKRMVHSASFHELQGTLWKDGQYFESANYQMDQIVDRVGGGDAFAGGVLHKLLEGSSGQQIIDFGTAASVLKHTVHGDCDQFSVQEVESFLENGSGVILR